MSTDRHHPTTPVIGYPSSLAGNISGTEHGPSHLAQSDFFIENNFLYESSKFYQRVCASSHQDANILNTVSKLCRSMAEQIAQQPFTTPWLALGGDHSMGIGTWSGLSAHCSGELGLLWIDAHFDSHTPETSHSQNIHGMPVACLLGYGPTQLTEIIHPQAKILPRNLCFVGIRDFETEEQQFLDRLGVRYFTMTDVHQQGLDEVMQLAYAHITQHSSHFGISIDLDSIDPRDAPGVSLPVPDGLRANELLTALKILQRQENFKRLIGLEIAEFHPASDMNQRTEQLIQDIIRAVMPQALRSQPIGSKE